MTAILDYLYLGLRASTSATFISTHTVTDVLSIGSSPLVILPGVAYHRLSLTDGIDVSLDRVISAANDFITAAADDQPRRRILVHCSAAVSRSPTVVAAYMISKHNMSLREALGLIITVRPAACPNTGFLAQLKELGVALRGECSLDVDSLPSKKTERISLFR